MYNFLKSAILPKISVYQLLATVPGIHKTKIFFVAKQTGVLIKTKAAVLTEQQLKNLSAWLEITFNSNEKHPQVGLELVQKIQSHRIFLKQRNNYKSFRLKNGLPVRGQRTHANAKTAKKLNR